MRERYGLLVSYLACSGCRKCVEACSLAHHDARGKSGLKISAAGPYRFPSGKTVTYFVAAPTDSCDGCALADVPACVSACPAGCLSCGEVKRLGTQMTGRNMALFTLPCCKEKGPGFSG